MHMTTRDIGGKDCVGRFEIFLAISQAVNYNNGKKQQLEKGAWHWAGAELKKG